MTRPKILALGAITLCIACAGMLSATTFLLAAIHSVGGDLWLWFTLGSMGLVSVGICCWNLRVVASRPPFRQVCLLALAASLTLPALDVLVAFTLNPP